MQEKEAASGESGDATLCQSTGNVHVSLECACVRACVYPLFISYKDGAGLRFVARDNFIKNLTGYVHRFLIVQV